MVERKPPKLLTRVRFLYSLPISTTKYMSKAFVSGHLTLTQQEFDDHYKDKIDEALKQNHLIIVGDARGCDFMTQQYVANQGHVNKLRVFHMFHSPRCLVEGAQVCACGFESDEQRDESMTAHSTYDIAWVRHGRETSGTQKNLDRRKKRA